MFRNPIPFKFATFFLSVFIMMGGWAHADEFSESEFFEESNGTEDSPRYSFENEKSFPEAAMATFNLVFDVQPDRTQFRQVQTLLFEAFIRVVQKFPGAFLNYGQI